jgi:quinol monooxygenase YgiN
VNRLGVKLRDTRLAVSVEQSRPGRGLRKLRHPDRREEIIEHVADLLERSRSEDGTLRYEATAELTEPNLIRSFELYEDAAAAEAHTASEACRRFDEALPGLVGGAIGTVRFGTGSIEPAEFTAAEVPAALGE